MRYRCGSLPTSPAVTPCRVPWSATPSAWPTDLRWFPPNLRGTASWWIGGVVDTAAARGSFDEFMVGRWKALTRTAYLLTGNRHDAEDVLQSALSRAAV